LIWIISPCSETWRDCTKKAHIIDPLPGPHNCKRGKEWS
jgi:hypothetical protein